MRNWLELELISIDDYSLKVVELLLALLVFAMSLLVARYLGRTLTRFAIDRDRMAVSKIYTLTRLLSYTIILIGALIALAVLGFSMDKLLLVAGALGVGIGFGLQNIVNNFVSGIVLLFEKSLRVGDFIELDANLMGEVKEINIRATLIRTLDNADILVPNADFTSGRLINWTLGDDFRRYVIDFGVAYGSDPAKVEQSVLQVAKDSPLTHIEKGREPAVLMTGFGDSSLNFNLVVWVSGNWVKRPGPVRSAYLIAIHDALVEHGIQIPFPQRDLHIKSVPEENWLGLNVSGQLSGD